MAACLADSLRFLIFSGMNLDKANTVTRTDRGVRGAVSAIQFGNSAKGALAVAAEKSETVAKCVDDVADIINGARSTSKVFDGVCKGANILSKMVNPLLCVASGVRVYKSEDKKSAAVKEGCAMGLMFTGEGIWKRLFGLGGHEASYKKYKPVNKAVTAGKKFVTSNKILNKIPAGRWGTLVKALGFVAVSCSCFSIGSKLGESTAKAVFKDNKETQKIERCALAVDPQNEDSTAEFVS